MGSEINKEGKKVSYKQFLKFIDRELPESPKNVLEVAGSTFIDKTREGAERDLIFLIEAAKVASKEEDIITADLFYELKELKEKELGLIYNYIAKYK